MAELTEVVVGLDDRSYPVIVGDGALGELQRLLPPSARRAAVVTQTGIPVTVETGIETKVFTLGPGEEVKTLSTVEELCRGFASWGLTRRDVVVAVGGGVVTDTAGFAAASYHRGTDVVHVSTTLLGQIDAAIGGKTGVNLPEGKNLVGAFWQPRAVICDTATLRTLAPREFRSGLGELAKYHFLGGGDLDRLDLVDQVVRCVRLKADVVSGDEREGDRRAVLNYGHTLAHALETSGHYDQTHGEAVAVGLIYASVLARLLDRIDDERVREHREVVAGYGLPVGLPPGSRPDELMAIMARDKKAVDGYTFALDGGNGVEIVAGIDRSHLSSAFEEMS